MQCFPSIILGSWNLSVVQTDHDTSSRWTQVQSFYETFFPFPFFFPFAFSLSFSLPFSSFFLPLPFSFFSFIPIIVSFSFPSALFRVFPLLFPSVSKAKQIKLIVSQAFLGKPMRAAAFPPFFVQTTTTLATKNHKHPIVGNKIDPCGKLFSHAEAF